MRKATILLVDDDPLILKAVGMDLEGRDFVVVSFDNGRAAIEELGVRSYDVVITDLVMDDVDGIAVLRAAKDRDADTMVLVLTGHGDLESAIQALRLDAEDYLLKPCDPEELFIRVTRCFDKLELTRKVKFYENILPVCYDCKKIRDDSNTAPGTGPWYRMEEYIYKKAGVDITSCLCPDCFEKAKRELNIEDP